MWKSGFETVGAPGSAAVDGNLRAFANAETRRAQRGAEKNDEIGTRKDELKATGFPFIVPRFRLPRFFSPGVCVGERF
jgi:hypothetical protein